MKQRIEIEKTAKSTFKERLALMVMLPLELFYWFQVSLFLIGVLIALFGVDTECEVPGRWKYVSFGYILGCTFSVWLSNG